MPVYSGSRYEGGDIDRAVHARSGGDSMLAVDQAPLSIAGVQFTTYRVVEGDRYDTIASKLLGDPKLWWMIADLNDRPFFPGGSLPAGALVRVPV